MTKDMTYIKNQWNLEMALAVLESDQVDSKTWAEAVEWLLLYGNEEIKDILNMASLHAMKEHFPKLQSSSFTASGQPCYLLSSLTESLDIDLQETQQKLSQTEQECESHLLFSEEDTQKNQ